MRRLRTPKLALVALPVGLALVVLGIACSADDVEAPAAKQSDLSQCKGFEQLMPNFLSAIRSGKTENLRVVIENHLVASDPNRPDVPPPINDVLRALFTTLNAFASQPSEPGALAGQLCAETPPPLDHANQLCEMRRALDLLVHQGKGLAAIQLLTPLLNAIINYIIGTGPDHTAHYEVAAVLGGGCAQDGKCQLSNGLDLLIALSTFLETQEGKNLQAQLNGLTSGDGGTLLSLLNPQSLTENDFVSLYNLLLSALQSADPAELDNLLNNPLLSSYKPQLQPVIDAVKPLLDPKHDPDIIDPLRKVVFCIQAKDQNSDVARMLYRLFLRDNLLSLSDVTTTLAGLQDIDPRGSLVHLLGTIAYAVRSDEQAIDSSASVCRQLLSTNPADNGGKSNAELALPVVSQLVHDGVIGEGICAIDTLIFGCSGGPQPACMSSGP